MECEKKSLLDQTSKSYTENLFEEIGYGKHQFQQIAISFFIAIIIGIDTTLIFILIIPLQEYFEITMIQMGYLGAIFSAGLFTGYLLVTLFMSKLSRTLTTKISVMAIIISQFCSVFVVNFYYFAICLYTIGLSIGMLSPLVMNTLCEYLPKRLRSYVMNAIWTGSSLGNIWTLILVLIFTPNFEIKGLQIILFILWATVFFSGLVFLVGYTDSPRNLILNKRARNAIKIVHDMAESCNISITRKEEEMIIEHVKKGRNSQNANSLNFIKFIFTKELRCTSIILIFLWAFISNLNIGPLILFPSTLQLLQISDTSIILSMLLPVFCGLIANSTFSLLTERDSIYGIGIKRLIILQALILVIISFMNLIWMRLIILWYTIFTTISTLAFNTLSTYTSLVYPTKIRDRVLAFFFLVSTISGISSQFAYVFLFKMYFHWPYFFMFAVTFGTFLFSLCIPYDPSGQEIDKEW